MGPTIHPQIVMTPLKYHDGELTVQTRVLIAHIAGATRALSVRLTNGVWPFPIIPGTTCFRRSVI